MGKISAALRVTSNDKFGLIADIERAEWRLLGLYDVAGNGFQLYEE